jgi:Trk K+ transport system NAD-binding subunit
MNYVLFLILRRMRAPLITLISVYAIAVAGLALIPGIDAQGNAAPMSIFHALYVMSYTATTIGFGELPNAFTDAQRLWVMFAIYLSVLGWAYALGSVIALVNDATFIAMVQRGRFKWRIKRIAEPFYILCGYGPSGALLTRALDNLGNRMVVIEQVAERAARIAIEEFTTPPYALVADARLADVLEDSGVRNPHCIGLIALADDDAVNQAIAIGARVLNPQILIVARAKSSVASVNLQSFGGVAVINPFDTFALNLEVLLKTPIAHRIEEFLTATPGSECPAPIYLPRGRWVLLGYGGFGRAIARMLDREGIEWKAIDSENLAVEDDRLFHGEETERVLRDAGIEQADVLVAGSDVDAVNLTATTLARRVRPDLFVVIRQNQTHDRALVDAANANMKFVESDLMVHECLQVLKTPMFARFLVQLRAAGAAVHEATLDRVRQDVGDGAPRAWTFDCDVMEPGMFAAFFQRAGAPFLISHLIADPTAPRERMHIAALMVERRGESTLLPAADMALRPGDRILFVGDAAARRLQTRYLTEPGTIFWACSGSEPPRGYIFRWLQQRLRAGAHPGA